ncbi:uncharacterized protein V1516DRAFT_677707 [Lipomyces oligophaga]|uniref:uncharacterized protein n=1 Tax=Lipomyces oligophaga TaxID=45792 RepID=UPI0034D00A14
MDTGDRSLLNSTPSTLYRWASSGSSDEDNDDETNSRGKHLFDHGNFIGSQSAQRATTDKKLGADRATILAKLLDTMASPRHQTRHDPPPEDSAADLVNLDERPTDLKSRFSTSLTDSFVFKAVKERQKVQPEPEPDPESVDKLTEMSHPKPAATLASDTQEVRNLEEKHKKEDFTYVLDQLRQLSSQCDARDRLISDLHIRQEENDRLNLEKEKKYEQEISSLQKQLQSIQLNSQENVESVHAAPSMPSFPSMESPLPKSKGTSNEPTSFESEEERVLHQPTPHRPSRILEPDTPMPERSLDSSGRTHEEMRLVESLNESLRRSLALEQELANAQAELAELRATVTELFCSTTARPSGPDMPPTPPSVRALDSSASLRLGSTSRQQHTISSSRLPSSFSSTEPQDIIDELEKLLAEADESIKHLRGNADIMGPGTMKDSQDFRIPAENKIYHRLEMYRIDDLGVSELGNIVKVSFFYRKEILVVGLIGNRISCYNFRFPSHNFNNGYVHYLRKANGPSSSTCTLRTTCIEHCTMERSLIPRMTHSCLYQAMKRSAYRRWPCELKS